MTPELGDLVDCTDGSMWVLIGPGPYKDTFLAICLKTQKIPYSKPGDRCICGFTKNSAWTLRKAAPR